MNWRQIVPNAFTLGNMGLGLVAITRATTGDLVTAAYCVGLAAIFDFLDGFLARLLHGQSHFGKDLDSLSDMVSFGVSPSIIWFNYSGHLGDHLYNYVALLPGLAAGVRLAQFNNDPRQLNSFIGLPTPAAAMWMVSIPLIVEYDSFSISGYLQSVGTLILVPLLISLLMVSPIPLFSMKFKNFRWVDNKHRYVLIALSAIFITLYGFLAIPFIAITYILMSLLRNFAS